MRRTALIVLVIGALSWAGQGTASAVTTSGRVCTIVGTAGNDKLVGTARNDVICGLGGDDQIRGGGGNDWLAGGPGWDWLWGGPGSDTFSGGADPDTVWYDDHNTPVKASLDAYANDGSANERDRLGADIENVIGGNVGDVLVGNGGGNVLYGGRGDDLLDGKLGGDTLSGGTGVDQVSYFDRTQPVTVTLDNHRNDGQPSEGDLLYDDLEVVVGGRGDDRLTGSPYADYLTGQGGNDTLKGLGGADYLDGDGGVDTVTYEDRTNPVTATLDGIANDGAAGEGDRIALDVESLVGGRGSDVLIGDDRPNRLLGGYGNDRLYGKGGDDLLIGHSQDDLVFGGDGRDVIYGGQGADRLFGDGGNDRINGDDGTNRLYGGLGLDFCQRPLTGAATDCEASYNGVSDIASGVVVAGHVLAADGSPVADAAVTVHGSRLLTDAQGAFGILTAGSDLYGNGLEVEVPVGSLGSASWRSSAAFAADQLLTLRLPVRHSVALHLQEPDGTSIAGADVGFPYTSALPGAILDPALPAFEGVEKSQATRRSGTTGEVSFPTYHATLPDLTFWVQGPALGTVTSTLRDLVVPEDGYLVRHVDIRPATITGTLRDPQGAGLTGATVHVGNGPNPGASTVVGNDGAFTVLGVKSLQDLQVKVDDLSGYPKSIRLSTPLDLRAGDHAVDLSLPSPQRFVVHVQDLTGQPLEGAALTLSEDFAQPGTVSIGGLEWRTHQVFAAATTDASGDVAIPLLAPCGGAISVRISIGDQEFFDTQDVQFIDGRFVFVLDTRTVQVTGTVTDESSVPLAAVTLDWATYDLPGGLGSAATAADGRFVLPAAVGSGWLSVRGTATNGAPLTFQATGRPVFDHDQVLDLQLDARHPVVLRVLTAAGAPVEGATFSDMGGYTDRSPFSAGLPGYTGHQQLDASALRSDAAGQVRFTALTGSLYGTRVRAVYPDGSVHTADTGYLTVSPSGLALDVRLT